MTLKVIPRLQAFSSAILRTFVQYFTRFQLTARSRGPSATAGLLVLLVLAKKLTGKNVSKMTYVILYSVLLDVNVAQVDTSSTVVVLASNLVLPCKVPFKSEMLVDCNSIHQP